LPSGSIFQIREGHKYTESLLSSTSVQRTDRSQTYKEKGCIPPERSALTPAVYS
jgi:hypothetical protein